MARVYADVNQNMPRAYWDYDSVNISRAPLLSHTTECASGWRCLETVLTTQGDRITLTSSLHRLGRSRELRSGAQDRYVLSRDSCQTKESSGVADTDANVQVEENIAKSSRASMSSITRNASSKF